MVRQSRSPRLILTRPRAQAERFAATLTCQMEVVFAPLLEIIWHDLGAINHASDLILTSENGALALKGASVEGRTAFCVGPRTTAVANGLGLDARDMGGTADRLVAALIEQAPNRNLLHLRGTHARGDIAERLRTAGLRCTDRIVYDQRELDMPRDIIDDLQAGSPDFVTLFSPRTAQIFAQAVPRAPNAEILCLSQAVSAALDHGAYGHIEVATQPTAPSLAEALYRRAAANRLEGPAASR